MVALSLLLLASVALATPIPSFADLGARDETAQHAAWDGGFTPVVLLDLSLPVTFPTAGIVWQSGGSGYMTWNNTLPHGVSQSQVASVGRLILGYTSDLSVGLHLDLANPLGTNIQLYNTTPRFDFTLPAGLPTRSTYVLSFQGSSGNISPEFTIEGVDSSSASSSASSSVSETSSTPTTGPIPAYTSHTSAYTSPATFDYASSPTPMSPEAASTSTAGPAANTIQWSSRGYVYSAPASSASGSSTSTVLSTTTPTASSANAAVKSSGSTALAARTLVAGFTTLLAASVLV